MSYIKDVIEKHIREYDKAKTGHWKSNTPPPPNTFDLSEIYNIGRSIISELEGYFSDLVIKGVIYKD